jgi:hypothetical protein
MSIGTPKTLSEAIEQVIGSENPELTEKLRFTIQDFLAQKFVILTLSKNIDEKLILKIFKKCTERIDDVTTKNNNAA